MHVLTPDDGEVKRIERMGVKPVVSDLAQLTDGKRDLYDKQDSIRHDPVAVAAVLLEMIAM
jgi:hypothetical protein